MSNDSSAPLAENATWQALQATALGEVRRRAALVAAVVDVEPTTVDGAERLAWNDGGGQSAVWYFTADGRALLLTFDHEGSLNLYAEDDYALQVSLYRGVPEDWSPWSATARRTTSRSTSPTRTPAPRSITRAASSGSTATPGTSRTVSWPTASRRRSS